MSSRASLSLILSGKLLRPCRRGETCLHLCFGCINLSWELEGTNGLTRTASPCITCCGQDGVVVCEQEECVERGRVVLAVGKEVVKNCVGWLM